MRYYQPSAEAASAVYSAPIDCIEQACSISTLSAPASFRRCTMSSYDRTGGNKDYDQRLYQTDSGKTSVLADITGPGCVYRMFFPTCGRPDLIISFYLDDSPEPAVRGTLHELFCGEHPLFPAPLAEIMVPMPNPCVESGYVCYVPIPFQRRLIITADNPTPMLYHIVDYALYLPGTQVIGFLPPRPLDRLIHALTDHSPIGQLHGSGCAQLLPGRRLNLHTVEAENTQISTLRLKFDRISADRILEADYDLLRNVRLTVQFDHQSAPSVDAPLAGVFAFSMHGPDAKEPAPCIPRACPAGIDEDGWLYLRLPMPFRHSAQISLCAGEDILSTKVRYEIYEQPCSGNPCQLHISHLSYEIGADDRNDITLLSAEGSGRLVGIVCSMDSDCGVNESSYLEGDEHIYIDGSRSPRINGTGTEDFYNGAYYWLSGAHSRPLFGCPYNAKWKNGSTDPCTDDATYKSTGYRFMLGDSVPFLRSLRFDMEHGFMNDRYEKGEATLFYYLNPHALLTASDEMQAAAPAEQHGLSVCGSAVDSLTRSQYEGSCGGPVVEERGLMLTGGNGISFTMKLVPGLTGAFLTRRFEYAWPNQTASVYIDDQFAGTWYDAGCNAAMRLRDSEFMLPAEQLRGKDSAAIRIEAESPVWSIIAVQMNCIAMPGSGKN